MQAHIAVVRDEPVVPDEAGARPTCARPTPYSQLVFAGARLNPSDPSQRGGESRLVKLVRTLSL